MWAGRPRDSSVGFRAWPEFGQGGRIVQAPCFHDHPNLRGVSNIDRRIRVENREVGEFARPNRAGFPSPDCKRLPTPATQAQLRFHANGLQATQQLTGRWFDGLAPPPRSLSTPVMGLVCDRLSRQQTSSPVIHFANVLHCTIFSAAGEAVRHSWAVEPAPADRSQCRATSEESSRVTSKRIGA